MSKHEKNIFTAVGLVTDHYDFIKWMESILTDQFLTLICMEMSDIYFHDCRELTSCPDSLVSDISNLYNYIFYTLVDFYETCYKLYSNIRAFILSTYELPHGKTTACIGENKGADQRNTAKLTCAFVFATRIVQFLFFLIQNFPPLSIFCDCKVWFVLDLVGKPRRPVFSCCGSYRS